MSSKCKHSVKETSSVAELDPSDPQQCLFLDKIFVFYCKLTVYFHEQELNAIFEQTFPAVKVGTKFVQCRTGRFEKTYPEQKKSSGSVPLETGGVVFLHCKVS
jgi:hypothetical protein